MNHTSPSLTSLSSSGSSGSTSSGTISNPNSNFLPLWYISELRLQRLRVHSQANGLQELEVFLSQHVNLHALHIWISNECLKYTIENDPSEDARLTDQILIRYIVALAGPVQQTVHPGRSTAFLGVQLKTLISAFALLHFRGNNGLRSDVYDLLKYEKFDSLYAIVREKRPGDEEKLRRATNKYLFQLAVQYFSIFGRSGDRFRESRGPVWNSVFATLSVASIVVEMYTTAHD